MSDVSRGVDLSLEPVDFDPDHPTEPGVLCLQKEKLKGLVENRGDYLLHYTIFS